MRIRRLRILGIAIALAAVAALAGVVAYVVPKEQFATINRLADFVVLNDATLKLHDGTLGKWLHLPDRQTENDHLRLVAISEQTLLDPKQGGIGAFPWKRSVYGTLLKKLHAAGATVVTFDVTFPDPSSPEQDSALADGFRAQRAVAAFSITTPGGHVYAEQPILPVQKTAAGMGYTTVDNPGGWTVGQPLINGNYKSLAARTLELYEGKQFRRINDWRAGFGAQTIPLDGTGEFLMLPFEIVETTDLGTNGGRTGASLLTAPFFQAVSVVDALNFDDATLKAFAGGNVVVIGTTAQALGDFVVTPTGRYPGVFANLRLMDQLMRRTFIRRAPVALDLVLIVLFPLIVGFLVTQLRPVVGIAISAGIVLVYSAVSILTYAYTLIWLNLVHVAAATLLAALFVALYRTITEGADKRVITEMFGKHVSPALVEQMLSHDDPLKALDLSGKRVRVTIFYSDIRGFTAMSEKMSPEEIYGALNEYFEEMCQIVFKYGGYVDKFIGDCLMAVFSAPNPHPDDAYNAVRSAWDQQQKILSMMTEWAAQGRPIFTVGMGLNTGEVVMGNLGSSDRLNYTVIGDNVNTAARLYNVAKGGQTIISESTYNEVKDRFIVNELPPVSVKGKELPLRNFEIIGLLEPGQHNPSTILDPDNLPEATVAADH
ncbi:MAG TPA: adenylate/guanylate cyclase domain-containing protein [Candidatus Elarobacter sp.]